MSAIVGIYYLDGRPTECSSIERMVTVLAHRGPDGAGVWNEGSVGLGHRMLWTTPESLHEELPLVDKTRDLVITADARIDNREELMEALGISASDGAALADSQLILSAYVKWGEECTQHLLGDFAFVIWDGRKSKLFCVRDHFGIKPFYYHHAPGKFFAFATEIKALLCLPEVPKKLNELRVAEYLTEMFDDTEITFYEDILRLPPAHVFIADVTNARAKRYYSLDPTREIHMASDEEYAMKFREIFTEAVRCRMRCASRVGAMLSGGLDSSSIACVARDVLKSINEKLPTFSNVFEHITECDEMPYVNEVLAMGGCDSHLVPGDKKGPLTDIDEILWHYDEPFYGPGISFGWELYRAAKNQDVRILLDGHGGDETVSLGYEYLQELFQKREWRVLYRELKGLAQHGLTEHSALRLMLGYLSNLASQHEPFKFGLRVWSRVLKVVQPQRWKESRMSWLAYLNPEFARRVGLLARYREQWRVNAQSTQSARHMHHKTLTGGLQPLALEMLDKSAAAFSIEPRYPLWDKRLVEFCLALPVEQKLERGWTRMILRRSMEGILPAKVQWRGDKMNFVPSVMYGLKQYNQNELHALTTSGYDAIKAYVDVRIVRDRFEKHMAGNSTHIGEDARRLLPIATLSLWLASVSSSLKCSRSVS